MFTITPLGRRQESHPAQRALTVSAYKRGTCSRVERMDRHWSWLLCWIKLMSLSWFLTHVLPFALGHPTHPLLSHITTLPTTTHHHHLYPLDYLLLRTLLALLQSLLPLPPPPLPTQAITLPWPDWLTSITWTAFPTILVIRITIITRIIGMVCTLDNFGWVHSSQHVHQ